VFTIIGQCDRFTCQPLAANVAYFDAFIIG